MKKIFLSSFCVLSLSFSPITRAEPMSAQSIGEIVASSAAGALAAGAGYAAYAYLKEGNLCHMSPEFAVLWVATGAIAGAAIRSNYVPESYLDWANERMQSIQNEEIFRIAVSVDSYKIEQLKLLFFKNPFPLYKAFLKLNYIYDALKEIKDAYTTVKNSHLTHVQFQCDAQLEMVRIFQEAIRNTIREVKDRPEFIAQANGYFEQQAAIAQQESAFAQQQAANAAWFNTGRPLCGHHTHVGYYGYSCPCYYCY